MSNQVHANKITDIIQVMNSGIDFYRDAIDKAEDSRVKSIFKDMINDKQDIIERLQPIAGDKSSYKEDGSSFAVESRNMYTKLAEIFSSDTDHTYVKQLEEVEDKVLEVMDGAIEEEQPASVLTKLREIRIKAQHMHDTMKGLQETTGS